MMIENFFDSSNNIILINLDKVIYIKQRCSGESEIVAEASGNIKSFIINEDTKDVWKRIESRINRNLPLTNA